MKLNLDDIKECPFCGRKDKLRLMIKNWHRLVECGCGAEGPRAHIDNPEKAVERWNTRKDNKNGQ